MICNAKPDKGNRSAVPRFRRGLVSGVMPALLVFGILWAERPAAAAPLLKRWVLRNPTGFSYTNEPVRLHLPVPRGAFTVKQDGVPVPYQVAEVDGKPFIWVSVSMDKGETRTFTTEPGERLKAEPKVKVRRAGDSWEMDNGLIAVRLAGPGSAGLVGPVQQVRLPNGKWVGEGLWHTGRKLTNFTAAVIGDGTVLGKIRLRYEFEGMAGLEDRTPAFAQVDVALHPGRHHLVIEECHEMGRNDAWEFDLCRGWGARTPVLEVFDGGAGRPKRKGPLLKDLRPLGWEPKALQRRYDFGDPRLGDRLMWLVPKSNQHYEDGWLFAVTDGTLAVGAIPCLPGRWRWGHDNKIAVQAKETADYAGLRCATRRGARCWVLLVGARKDFTPPAASDYVLRHIYKGLDKILIEYITDWPGQDDKQGFYAGPFNPLTRAFRPEGVRGSIGDGPMDWLTVAQVALGPDMIGTQWRYWSTENPNFFSGYVRGWAVRFVPKLKEHPRYEELRRWAAQRVAEDFYYAITLPSGAGQECPGYQKRDARGIGWCEGLPMADDMKARAAAAQRFLRRISSPDGAIRRFSPMGDSHPGRDPKTGHRGMGRVDVPAEEVKAWKTEELHGYGVVFSADPGTSNETFLAFKSGPNRGHFHGDQLAFLYCAHARPLAVDHHCSYNPRAGQEHMHNRVAFSTDDMPYANMDGYERVIAFKTSEHVDVAVGQVESERLRFRQQYPPEDWDRDFPQVRFTSPLVHRRTVVFLKGGKEHYFVLRDQYRADRKLRAAYCLHVNAPGTLALEVKEPDGGNAAVVGKKGVFRDAHADFKKAGVKPGWHVLIRDRHTRRDECLVVRRVRRQALWFETPLPPGNYTRYRILKSLARMRKGRVSFGDLTLFVAHPPRTRLVPFPWAHANGGLEETQGVRLETVGDSGEFITVLYPGADPPAMSALRDGTGVRVGDDEVRFAGGIDEDGATTYVTVIRGGREAAKLTGKEIDLDRFQGDIGLWVPNTGYPFGEIPEWLIRQRIKPPAWYREMIPLGYRQQ